MQAGSRQTGRQESRRNDHSRSLQFTAIRSVVQNNVTPITLKNVRVSHSSLRLEPCALRLIPLVRT